jgi:hypothetical protein
MKRLIVAIATSMFMASAGASHVYHGLAEGNPSLHGYGHHDQELVGVQPGIGDRVDIYHGLGSGNADLFSVTSPGGSDIRSTDTGLPRIYDSFTRNPDLTW